VIGTDGTVQNLKVISGHEELQQAALDSVKGWRYRPFLLNGEPVEVQTTVNVIFALSR
jgi:protein TonB